MRRSRISTGALAVLAALALGLAACGEDTDDRLENSGREDVVERTGAADPLSLYRQENLQRGFNRLAAEIPPVTFVRSFKLEGDDFTITLADTSGRRQAFEYELSGSLERQQRAGEDTVSGSREIEGDAVRFTDLASNAPQRIVDLARQQFGVDPSEHVNLVLGVLGRGSTEPVWTATTRDQTAPLLYADLGVSEVSTTPPGRGGRGGGTTTPTATVPTPTPPPGTPDPQQLQQCIQAAQGDPEEIQECVSGDG